MITIKEEELASLKTRIAQLETALAVRLVPLADEQLEARVVELVEALEMARDSIVSLNAQCQTLDDRAPQWEQTIEHEVEAVVTCWFEECYEGAMSVLVEPEQLTILKHHIEIAIRRQREEYNLS